MGPETTDRVLALLDLIRRIARWQPDRATSEPEARRFRDLARLAETLAETVTAERRPAVRVFARVQGADLECPRCGLAFSFGFVRAVRATIHATKQRRGAGQWYWDSSTATLTCPKCSAEWVPALALYRRVRTWRKSRRGLPVDQLADDRQRAELRACAKGYWLEERVTMIPQQTNWVAPEGCTCDPGPERAGTDADCPVHRRDPENPAWENG